MKIKEVCGRTGLTERTVRFYVEKGLAFPRTEERNGREYREYTEENLRELETAANLRRLCFSIEEIKRMTDDPKCIKEVVREYGVRTKAEAAQKQMVLETVEKMDLSNIRDIRQLSQRLEAVSRGMPLPQADVRPDFGKNDAESKEEKETEYQGFLMRQERRYKWGKGIVYALAAMNVLASAGSMVLDFSFRTLFSLAVQIALSIALCCGVRWVRWLFVAGSALGAAGMLRLIFLPEFWEAGSAFLIIYAFSALALSAATALLLIFSNAVREFLYMR